MKPPAERREFQRLDLPEPVPAVFNGMHVLVVDLGVLGAGIVHEAQFGDSEGQLVIEWEGEIIQLDGGIVRTLERTEPLGGFTLHSGVRFFRALGESDVALRRMLASIASAEIERRRPAMAAVQAAPISEPLHYDAPFISLRHDGTSWRKRPVYIPEQPADGFTLPAESQEGEITRLCLAYEISEPEAQRLIRLFAELSVSESLGIPRRRAAEAIVAS